MVRNLFIFDILIKLSPIRFRIDPEIKNSLLKINQNGYS